MPIHSGRVQEQYVFTVRVPKIRDGQVLRAQDRSIGEKYIRVHVQGGRPAPAVTESSPVVRARA
jgi:hypothetical protein